MFSSNTLGKESPGFRKSYLVCECHVGFPTGDWIHLSFKSQLIAVSHIPTVYQDGGLSHPICVGLIAVLTTPVAVLVTLASGALIFHCKLRVDTI